MSTENDTDGTLLDEALDLLREVPAEHTSERWYNDRADLDVRVSKMRARLRMAEQEQTSEPPVTRAELAWVLGNMTERMNGNPVSYYNDQEVREMQRAGRLYDSAMLRLSHGLDARGPEHDSAEGSDE